jgi:ankyrin repeat protein
LQIKNEDGHAPQMMHKRNNSTILHYACQQGKLNEHLMKMLIDAGAPHTRDSSGYTPLDYVCVRSDVTETKITMFIGVADLNARDKDNCTPLHFVCGNAGIRDIDRLSVIKVLLKGGADPNVQNVGKCTPLHYACANSQVTDKVLKVLLDAGADPLVEDSYECLPLHHACAYGHYSSSRYLILNSLYSNAALPSAGKQGYNFALLEDCTFKTIVHHACEKGDFELVAKLITEHADFSIQDCTGKGYTPLHYAIHLSTMLVQMATLRLHNYL